MSEAALEDVVKGLLDPSVDVTNCSNLFAKRVLLRVDFNVPVDEVNGQVTDASRITAVLPTIRLLLERNAKVILASHFGRPEPKKQSREEMMQLYSLRPIAELLQTALGPSVFRGLSPDCVGAEAEAAVASLQNGQALLLENTRFHAGDAANSASFAAQLAALCDVFVNDAFGVVHRDQGSVTGVAQLVPEVYPGPLIRAELKAMAQHVLYHPARPLGVVLGGAKVADKIGIIAALIEIADVVLVGGKMAFTLLAARGVSVGSTQVEANWLETCRAMMARAEARGTHLLLPVDVLWSSSLAGPVDTTATATASSTATASAPTVPPTVPATSPAAAPASDATTVNQTRAPDSCASGSRPSDSCASAVPAAAAVATGVQVLTTTCCTESSPCIPAGRYGVDIGPKTMRVFSDEILRCRTVFWNGPMGKFEVPQFSGGTTAVARALDEASRRGAVTVIGGGDSVAAVVSAGLAANITHISTGGGACLELIEGKGMPGLRALLRRPRTGSTGGGERGGGGDGGGKVPGKEGGGGASDDTRVHLAQGVEPRCGAAAEAVPGPPTAAEGSAEGAKPVSCCGAGQRGEAAGTSACMV